MHEDIDEFKYLVTFIKSDRNLERQIATRIAYTERAFDWLRNTWNYAAYSMKLTDIQ